MNLEKYNLSKDGFGALDFWAYFQFKTQNSISFGVERYSSSLCSVRQLGWIDIHYPCEDHIKVQIRACLPHEYHDEFDKMKVIIETVMTNLDIPADETYEFHAFIGGEMKSLIQSVDREGCTDRL